MKSTLSAALAGLALIVTTVACGRIPSPFRAITTMPSPDGCYLQVWDQPRFAGASDFIHGPRRYDNLHDVPGNRTWKNRIKSLHLGPRAVAIAWSDEQFRGKNAVLIADSQQRTYPTVPLTIESLDIRCLPSQADRVPDLPGSDIGRRARVDRLMEDRYSDAARLERSTVISSKVGSGSERTPQRETHE